MAWSDLARTYWRMWRGREAVVLAQAGTGGQTFAVQTAMRAPPVVRAEKQPTGARYLVADTTWRVPGPLLPAGTELLPGDRLTADEFYGQSGTITKTWTVLRAEQNPWDRVWTLDTIHLGLHPRLGDVVTIQRPALDPVTGRIPRDATGGETFSWETVAEVTCAVIVRRRDDMDLNDVVGAQEEYLIVFAEPVDLTVSRDRLILNHAGTGTAPEEGELVLDVLSYEDMELIDELPQAICARKP